MDLGGPGKMLWYRIHQICHSLRLALLLALSGTWVARHHH